MKYLTLIIISFIMVGCCDCGPKIFTLSDGKQLRCNDYDVHACGMHLKECNDGIEYQCQQNVKVQSVKHD